MPTTTGSALTALPSISTPTTATASASHKASHLSSQLYDVPSLENDGTNFQNWKYRVSTVLNIRGLIGLINGTELKPDGSDPLALENWLQGLAVVAVGFHTFLHRLNEFTHSDDLDDLK
ncbi:hypothetical protein PAXRUDRAFT_181098 [Paxillus rubicundulus Ve08.2h10]|uniref:Retrotransposon Copia-like N-terminal domain-containing protein n=1 Tax=Paxillus rubicundulus Ve08.2h10 TaxID=930991 RepID=A0A0D0C996_9AGAM|nr:hypothetical protein PAXRUDRAFT_181098 [Paxillus rubicundulus Ve08.2h10]